MAYQAIRFQVNDEVSDCDNGEDETDQAVVTCGGNVKSSVSPTFGGPISGAVTHRPRRTTMAPIPEPIPAASPAAPGTMT